MSSKYTGPAESEIQARILRDCGALPGIRLFRNSVGEGWQGKVLEKSADTVTLFRPRYVTFGLCPGSTDLIGWNQGRFFAPEVKRPGEDPRPDQVRFMDAVNLAGGIAGVVRSTDDMLSLILGVSV